MSNMINQEIDNTVINAFESLFNSITTNPYKDLAVALSNNQITPELYVALNGTTALNTLYQQINSVNVADIPSLLNLTFFPQIHKKIIDLPNLRVSRYL